MGESGVSTWSICSCICVFKMYSTSMTRDLKLVLYMVIQAYKNLKKNRPMLARYCLLCLCPGSHYSVSSCRMPVKLVQFIPHLLNLMFIQICKC